MWLGGSILGVQNGVHICARHSQADKAGAQTSAMQLQATMHEVFAALHWCIWTTGLLDNWVSWAVLALGFFVPAVSAITSVFALTALTNL
jgi:hypothetical protein